MRGRWRLLWLGMLALGLCELALWQLRERQRSELRQQLVGEGAELRAQLESRLNSGIYLSIGLITYLQGHSGELDEAELAPWMHNLVERGLHVRNISVAPGNRIRYVYPRQGNEAALGLYFPDIPEQWPAVQKVIRERKPALLGPLVLKQGGNGLIYRSPVFRNGEYWGLVNTVIDSDGLLATLAQHARSLGVNVALAETLPDAPARPFWGELPQPGVGLTASIPLELPGQSWSLLVSRAEDTELVGSLRVIALTVLAVLFALLWQAQRLREEQAAREHEMQAQLALSSLVLEQIDDGILSLDRQGRVLATYARAAGMLERRPEQIRGLRLDELLPLPGLAGDQLETWLERQHQTHGGDRRLELPRLGRPPLPVEFRVIPLHNVPRATWLLVLSDLSARLHGEQVKSDFIAIVSHELRTPLTAVSGSLGLLLGGIAGELPDKVRELLGMAQKNAQRLGRLIDDLLDMEKLAAGRMPLERQIQPLLPLLDESLKASRTFAEQHLVRLLLSEHGAAAAVPLRVDVDGLRLRQVLGNLLSNAIKFSPSGEQVSLDVVVAGGRVRIEVRDHGPGVPEAFQARIFEKFSQAEAASTREKGGSGLGLALSRALVEQMGGRLDFESPPGQGACFFVELPLAANA